MSSPTFTDDGKLFIEDEPHDRMAAIAKESQAFQMPKVRVGVAVLYHPDAVPSPHSGVAWVCRINRSGRALELRTSDGIVRDAVPHVTDPRLRMNESQREDGSWDFTDEHRHLMALERRIETLESQAAALIQYSAKPVSAPAKVTPKTEPLADFAALKKKAKSLGCPLTTKTTKAELEEMIRQAEARASDPPKE